MDNNQTPVTQTEEKKEVSATQTENKNEKKTFTQDEVNAMILKETNKINKKYEGIDLEKYKKWEESQKTETEKQQEQLNKLNTIEKENQELKQINSVFSKGITDKDEAEFIQFKVSRMEGNFEDNLEKYFKDHPVKKEEPKKSTGFSQKTANESVSEEKAYLDKKYANNPYYKK